MWCNAGHRHDRRGPLIGITFTWGARFLIQRKKNRGRFGVAWNFWN